MISLEMIMALTIFVVVLVLIIGLISFTGRDPYRELQAETVILSTMFTQGGAFQVVNRGSIDIDRFVEYALMDYEELRRQLGIRSDFCIYLEDADGNVTTIQVDVGGTIINISGIGNGSPILVGGVSCGQ